MIILVRFRGDILRGLRVGAILFAVLLVGVAVYRVMREAPPPDSTVAKPPAAEPAAVTPTAAVSAPPPLAVPAPPPISSSHPQVRRRPAGQPTVVADSAPPVEPAPAAAVEEKLAPVEAKSQPQTAPERAEVAGSPTTNEEPGQKSDRRSKRWVKAVGRFLHVTPKKDVQPEAVRQP